MRHDEDTALMSPNERRAAVAEILAAGVLRLRGSSASLPVRGEEEISESGPDSLEVSPGTVLSVHVG